MYNKLRKMGYEPMSEKSKMRFRCDGCGKCCKNREDIILNAYDIFRIRKKLDITLEEFLLRPKNLIPTRLPFVYYLFPHMIHPVRNIGLLFSQYILDQPVKCH